MTEAQEQELELLVNYFFPFADNTSKAVSLIFAGVCFLVLAG